MKTKYRVACVRRDSWPETERWARRFVARPAASPADSRHQAIVADLLAEAGVR